MQLAVSNDLTRMVEEQTERGKLLRGQMNDGLATQKRTIGFEPEIRKGYGRLTLTAPVTEVCREETRPASRAARANILYAGRQRSLPGNT
jgi:hypothetical protein